MSFFARFLYIFAKTLDKLFLFVLINESDFVSLLFFTAGVQSGNK